MQQSNHNKIMINSLTQEAIHGLSSETALFMENGSFNSQASWSLVSQKSQISQKSFKKIKSTHLKNKKDLSRKEGIRGGN